MGNSCLFQKNLYPNSIFILKIGVFNKKQTESLPVKSIFSKMVGTKKFLQGHFGFSELKARLSALAD